MNQVVYEEWRVEYEHTVHLRATTWRWNASHSRMWISPEHICKDGVFCLRRLAETRKLLHIRNGNTILAEREEMWKREREKD